jgi:hypothetical protein
VADVRCRCHLLARVVVGGTEFRGLRCPACIDAILESKNELVRENNALRLGTVTGPAPPGVPLKHPVDPKAAF